MRYFFVIIITAIIYMSIGHTDHKKFELEFEEFLAREELMTFQMNLWELLQQLEYTHGEQRSVVKDEITVMRENINKQIIKILELDLGVYILSKIRHFVNTI